MHTPITIGISACLFGKNTRYDGGNRHEPLLMAALGKFVTLVPFCPEADCGLGIPREPMRLEGDCENPRLVTITTRCDLTGKMQAWCDQRLKRFKDEAIGGLILKARSPSCGRQVAVHGKEEGQTPYSPGIFTRLVMEHFPSLPIADEEDLQDPIRLHDFLKRITVNARDNQEKEK